MSARRPTPTQPRPHGLGRILHPSSRKAAAQRMFSATTLVVEAFVVFFAVLVAHQLSADSRATTWAIGMGIAIALVGAASMLRRTPWAYVAGMVLQIPVILMGLIVPMMWWLGLAFAVLYIYGVYKGHTLDAEKDAIDARWYAEHGEGADGEGS